MDGPEDTYRVALVRAAVLLGGAVPLARRLQVPMPELTKWLAGADRPSIGTFLKVVDILLEASHSSRFISATPMANEQPKAANVQPEGDNKDVSKRQN